MDPKGSEAPPHARPPVSSSFDIEVDGSPRSPATSGITREVSDVITTSSSRDDVYLRLPRLAEYSSQSTILLETCDSVAPSRSAPIQEEENHEASPQHSKVRSYYLDWMRIIAIYLVVFYHCVQALDWVGMWCGYQKQQDISFRCVALQIGMPMFFHISGRAQAMAKPARFRQVIWRRSLRLLLPFLICYAVLIPPWIWIHDREIILQCQTNHVPKVNETLRSTDYHTKVSPDPEVAQNLFLYLYRYWTFQHFKPDPAWLWFLPVLYLVTVSSTPVFLLGELHQRRYLLMATAWWLIMGILSSGLLRYDWTFGAALGIAPIGSALLSYKVPFPPLAVEPAGFRERLPRYLAIRGTTMLHVIVTVILVESFSYEDIDKDPDSPLRAIPQMFIYPLFYTQGFFSQRWWPEGGSSKRIADHLQPEEDVFGGPTMWVKLYQFATVMVTLLVIFAGSPVGDWEFSSWPIYSRSFHGEGDLHAAGYVLSTWAWIGIADAIFQAYADDIFYLCVHRHASASTIVVYIFHWAFIKPFVWFVVRDGGMIKWGPGRYLALPLTFLVGAGGSLAVYVLLLRVPQVGWLFGI